MSAASDFTDEADAFEAVVARQVAGSPDDYDVAYFADEWRDHENRYEIETRRRVEARHPALIREVFAPRRVLDVGCGPGFLMQFLHELGVRVDGVDFAPASLELAPDAVRDRISIGPVDALAAGDASYDLVVCREVIEHVTLLQARRCVAEMCRVSSDFVYVTTRYHPKPASLLDVRTTCELDPTHITLMTKGLLRALFVLEGFRRRADLEQRMDWAGKDRVLVYQRSPQR